MPVKSEIPDNFILEPTPHEEAAALLRSKPVVTSSIYNKLSPELKAMAFTITGIESADILQYLRDVVANVPRGANWNEAKKEIAKELVAKYGEKEALRRAELVLRHHCLTAYRVGEWELAQETKAALPYFKYIASMDGRTRASHAALHGLVLPVDDPFWDSHMPPGWDWGCRCQVVQVSDYDVEQQRKAEKKLPPERRRVLTDAQKRELRNGRITVGPSEYVDVRSALEKGKSGPASLKSLRFPKKEILARYKTPKAQKEFLESLEKIKLDDYEGNFTVRDWFEGKPLPPLREGKNIYRPVGESFIVDRPKNNEIDLRPIVDTASLYINRVHFDGMLPKTPVNTAALSAGLAGVFRPKGPKIEINPSARKPLYTMIHETGHFIDYCAIGKGEAYGSEYGSLASDVMLAIENTPTTAMLRAKLAMLKKIGKSSSAAVKAAEYYLEPAELFARAYAQYILTKNGREDFIDMKTHWPVREFSEIEKAFDKMFKHLGWWGANE